MPRHPRTTLAAACAFALAILTGCSQHTDAGTPTATISSGPAPVITPSVDSEQPTAIGGPAIVNLISKEDVATGLESPWSMIFLQDGSILVTERDTGRIKRVRAGVPAALDGPGAQAIQSMIDTNGEGGLLGLAQSPTDPSLLYAYVTRTDGNAVIRLQLQGDFLASATEVLTGIPAGSHHDGGRMAFGPDGYLYIGTGDAGNPDAAQDENSLAGKILRVIADGSDKDGQAAPDNPFGTRVWTLGHRNVEGFGWVADGRMYASELGQDGQDELNLIQGGHNYGWPTVEGMLGAPAGTQPGAVVDGLTYPVTVWSPDEASPSGLAITREGIYIAALKGERLIRVPLTIDGIGTPQTVLSGIGRIRDVAVGPDGAIYAMTNNTDGRGTPKDGDDRIVKIAVG